MRDAIEPLPKTEAELRATFWDQVSSFPDGHKIKRCLQCGTCSGACPVSYAMDLTPREVIALFRAGYVEEILKSRTIWLCASCYSCTVRCPVGIRVTDTMYAFKRTAMVRKLYPRKFPVHVLSRSFTEQVYKYGRNFELGLGIRYLLRSKWTRLFASAGFGLSMIRRGRLGVIPRRIRRVKEVRAIIERADTFGEGL